MVRKKKNRTAEATVVREVRSNETCIKIERAISKEEETKKWVKVGGGGGGAKGGGDNGAILKEKEKKKKKKLVVYGNKKVLVSFINKCKPVSWLEIDPHYSGDDLHNADEIDDCFAVTRMPGTMNSPPSDLDVYRLLWLETPVFDSKVYFIGGSFLDYDNFLCYGDNTNEHDWYFSTVIDRDYKIYSDKVFTYHLFSRKWEELSSKLNIARGYAHVVIAGSVAYIIGGGIIDYSQQITTKEHWIECFNLLDDGKKNAAWEFLPANSAPPDAVFEDYMPMYTFVYELGNLIVFVMSEAGCYAFNYVSKTWAPFHENINKHVRVPCYKVVVVDHLLFWHDLGFIHAYDLKNNRLVLSHHLNQLKISKDVDTPSTWGSRSFLERVGNDTLLLICQDVGDVIGKKLHFYKFQIQNLSQVSYDNLGLNQIGCGRFSSSGILLRDVIAV